MIVLVYLIVLLGGVPSFHDFSHGASHPYILIHSFLHLFHIFLMVAYKTQLRACVHA